MTLLTAYLPHQASHSRFLTVERYQHDLSSPLAHLTLFVRICKPIMPVEAIPENPSPQLSVVLDWARAFADHDFELYASCITDDHVHAALPDSLGLPPFVGKNTVLARMNHFLPYIESRVVSSVQVVYLSSCSCHLLAAYNCRRN